MYQGSCLCGCVTYQFFSEPKMASNCHCNMCQKQHGAAFATYINVPKSEFRFTSGEEHVRSYSSSPETTRQFCGQCGSSLVWRRNDVNNDRVSITLASLDTEYVPKRVEDFFTNSKPCWLER